MRVFITGTDTDVGKTTICSWLCLHTQYAYFKPIQTGNTTDVDKKTVKQLSNAKIYEEAYSFIKPVSPHLAAKLDNTYIHLENIQLPNESNLIIEGAGGLLVPINDRTFIIDLIQMFDVTVILVARSTLGTINHTLLSLESLRKRNIKILGVIMNGEYNEDNKEAIEFYGQVKVLASFPKVLQVTTDVLLNIKLSSELKSIFKIN
ncbi:hypothetical protein PGB90_006592 [Kerria lacca]